MVQLNPELDKKFIQTPVWNLSLEDDECVSVGFAIG